MEKKSIGKKIICIAITTAFLSSNIAYAKDMFKKDESVYVTLTSSGQVKETIVSDWLHTNEANVEIKDKSILNSIVNVKGYETPDSQGEKLIWKSEKQDIFYQGTTNKSLPIEVEISYMLDGNEISPQELGGKSGKVKIDIKFINKESHTVNIKGKNKTLYTPFTAIAVLNMPIDNFSSVKISSGEVVSDGNNQVVTFIGFPGLQESLGIDRKTIDLPSRVEITADASNFKMGPIMITATPQIPDTGKLKSAHDINELIDGIKQLKDASGKLSKGTGMIADGQRQVADNINTLSAGLGKLSIASSEINNGTSKLAEGTGSALNGALKLSGGIIALEQGLSKLTPGVEGFVNGANDFADNSKKFADGAVAIADGTVKISEKTGELSTGLNKLVQATEELKAGQNQITQGAAKSLEGIKTLKAAKEVENKALGLLSEGIDGLKKLVSLLSGIPGTGEITEKLNSGLNTQKTGVQNLIDSGNQIVGGLNELETGISSIKAGSEKLDLGLSQLQDGQKQAAYAAEQIAKGGQTLAPSAKALQDGSEGLKSGANKLSAGAKELSVATSKFGPGVKELSMGSQGLVQGLTQLDAGANDLSNGTKEFSSKLKGALIGASKLTQGANQLAKGSDELDRNMKKFDTEGIGKLYSSVNGQMGDIDEILASKDEIIKLSKNYETFTGIGEDGEGTVKFIMKTDEIKAPEVISNTAPVKVENKGFFNWLKSLFKK